MPRDSSDSASRKKKDKHSSRDCHKASDAAEEFTKRKSVGKHCSEDIKVSKKDEASGHGSGRKRHYVEREDNCFASEYDDFEDSKKHVHSSTYVTQQHSRNGLVLAGMFSKHSLVDYDYESSDSESSSVSFSLQYPAARRKSAVQVVPANVKADLNDLRQRSHKSDVNVSRLVRMSSDSYKKQSSTDSVNCDERSDKKKSRQLSAESSEPECKAKDIPVKSPKCRHSKDHHGSRKHDVLTSEQINSRKPQLVDKPHKAGTEKAKSKENDPKRVKRRDTGSENEVVSSSAHTGKSKAHKKSKKSELYEEQCSDGDTERRSQTNKLTPVDAAVYKKEKSQKVHVMDNSNSQSKTEERSDRWNKVDSHVDSVNGIRSLSHGSSSVQQNDHVLKHSSDDHVHIHRKHEKKHSSKKKSYAEEHLDNDDKKEKKDRSALKHDEESIICKSDKKKDRKNKDKSHHSRNEREFSDEGQISSDSSGGVSESKQKRRSHATLRNGSITTVKSSQNALASSKKAVSSESCHPER